MPAQDWSRVRKTAGFKGPVDANSIPIGAIVGHFGGEVREGKSVSVHNDNSRTPTIIVYAVAYTMIVGVLLLSIRTTTCTTAIPAVRVVMQQT